MQVGIPKEVKNNEARVSVTPETVKYFTDNSIVVVIENNAGLGCGFTNEDYIASGAIIVNQEQVWESKIILKVKEPQEEEYKFFKQDQIIWGFLHLAANPSCVQKMVEKNITAIASETIKKDNEYNLLTPVSKIAGRRSMFVAQLYNETQFGGQGLLLSGIEGHDGANVVIFGGGVVGEHAAIIASAMGCKITIIELNKDRQSYLKSKFKSATILDSTPEILHEACRGCDVLISTILIPGSKPPKLVKTYMVKDMKKGSIIVDVAIDQGGSVETIESPTSHSEPIFIKYGVIHYAVPNMPGAVSLSATKAIQEVKEYVVELANDLNKLNTNSEINFGVQIQNGCITNENLKKSIEEY